MGTKGLGWPRYVAGLIGLACAYALSAQFGILIAASHQLVTAVWPPSGIALAVLVIGGRRYWPGVAVGAFAAEAIAGLPWPTAAMIAVGNTVAVMLAAFALERAHVRRELGRVRDVLTFFVLAAATMTISATIGTSVLALAGDSGRSLAYTWLTWWVGDAMGVILITPIAMTLSRGSWLHRWPLNAFFVVVAGVVSWELWWHGLPIRHLIVPVAIFAALKLGPRGTSMVSLSCAIAAIAAMVWSSAPQSFVLLQTLNASVAMLSLTLSALVNERRVMHDELRGLADDLEGRVAERTEALERANAHLRELDATKNAILSAVSHELRTPLTAILGFTELLQTPDIRADDEMSDQLLERLEASSRRLSRLLQDLLDLGRLESGVIEPKREKRAICELVDASLLDVDVADHQLEVVVEGTTSTADPTHVERIINNLVTNAAKYTPDGTTIALRVHGDEEGGVSITVTDEGPGIPADRRETVFEPFERLGDRTHAQGAGVGLALVRRFAHMHHGDAWVEDAVSGGCAFHVELPSAAEVGRVA